MFFDTLLLYYYSTTLLFDTLKEKELQVQTQAKFHWVLHQA